MSAQIVATAPIMVERAMYLTGSGRTFNAGHESAGVTEPALQWFLAEGATGPYFDLFMLLANPARTPSQVTATFLKPDGSTVVKAYTLSRRAAPTSGWTWKIPHWPTRPSRP